MFWLILRGFWLRLPTPYELHTMDVVRNRGKFDLCSICGCQVINFQMFSWWYSIHEMAPLGEFLGPFSPNMTQICCNFDPRNASHKPKTVFEQFFKIQCSSVNGAYPKLTVLNHFWAHFTSRNPKILPKIKIFPETTSLWLSNNTSPRSQINHRILIKLILKKHFLGQIWTF